MTYRKLDKVIAGNVLDTGNRYKQPILVTASNGYSLTNHTRDLWCEAGAKTVRLVQIIKGKLYRQNRLQVPSIIYLWSGTCDLTRKT